jgi:hypothetical protein
VTAELGNVKAVARQIEERERDEIKARLTTVPIPIDLDAVEKQIEARVAELTGLLAGSPVEAREALGRLFGEGRIRVYSDSGRGFRIEGGGLWELDPAATGWCPGRVSTLKQHPAVRLPLAA